jgi:hypothetical protein
MKILPDKKDTLATEVSNFFKTQSELPEASR